jgi:hypothetical protein
MRHKNEIDLAQQQQRHLLIKPQKTRPLKREYSVRFGNERTASSRQPIRRPEWRE